MYCIIYLKLAGAYCASLSILSSLHSSVTKKVQNLLKNKSIYEYFRDFIKDYFQNELSMYDIISKCLNYL